MRLPSSEPPPDLRYEDLDDWQARAILTANGIGESENDLVAVLRSDDANVRALAAHQLGALGARDAVTALVAAQEDDEVVAVEAAWALARIGGESAQTGQDRLLALAGEPVETSVVPLRAAGYLARLGRPDGFPAVRAGLRSDNFLVRIAAAKQLSYFVPLDGAKLPDGTSVDLRPQFRRALTDEEDDVREAARYQLDQLGEEVPD